MIERPPFQAHFQTLLALLLLLQLDKSQQLQAASLAQSADGQDASVRLQLASGSIAAQSHSSHASLLTDIPLHAAASIEFRAGAALCSTVTVLITAVRRFFFFSDAGGDSMLGVRCLLAHKYRCGLTQLGDLRSAAPLLSAGGRQRSADATHFSSSFG